MGSALLSQLTDAFTYEIAVTRLELAKDETPERIRLALAEASTVHVVDTEKRARTRAGDVELPHTLADLEGRGHREKQIAGDDEREQ